MPERTICSCCDEPIAPVWPDGEYACACEWDGCDENCPVVGHLYREAADAERSDTRPKSKMREGISCVLASPALLLTLVAADPAVTYLAVRAGATEGHPMWDGLIASMGLGNAMILRLIMGMVLITAVIVAVRDDLTPITASVLRVLTVVFGIIVIWNLVAWISAWGM